MAKDVINSLTLLGLGYFCRALSISSSKLELQDPITQYAIRIYCNQTRGQNTQPLMNVDHIGPSVSKCSYNDFF